MKDYFLKHRSLSERDLDDLVTKSSMSYEQVRDWFFRTSRRAEEGKELFSEEDVEAEEVEKEEGEGAGEPGDSEGDMEVKEQGEEQEAIQEESEALSQSQAEEQT